MSSGTQPLSPQPDDPPADLNRRLEIYQAKMQLLAGGWIHDFRNALNSVNGYATLMFDDVLPPDKHPEAIRAIYRGGQQLVQLTNNLYDFLKIETGEMKVEAVPCALRECIENVLQHSKERAQDCDIALDCQIAEHVPETIIGDRMRILHLFIILVDSAFRAVNLRAGPAGAITIYVAVEAAAETPGAPGYLRFSVQDTGMGLYPANLKHLQAYLSQPGPVTMPYAPSSGEKRGGPRRDWPLEMTLLKQLSDSVGGTLTVDSASEQGPTTFHCSFQYTEVPPAA